VGTKIWRNHPFTVNTTIADGLRQYAKLDYPIGPFFLACILLTVLAACWRPRQGDWRLRLDALFFMLLGVGVTLGAIATANFSYRYTVPLYVTLPLAAAFALTHLLAQRGRKVETTEATT
jgi:hypothetical protein